MQRGALLSGGNTLLIPAATAPKIQDDYGREQIDCENKHIIEGTFTIHGHSHFRKDDMDDSEPGFVAWEPAMPEPTGPAEDIGGIFLI